MNGHEGDVHYYGGGVRGVEYPVPVLRSNVTRVSGWRLLRKRVPKGNAERIDEKKCAHLLNYALDGVRDSDIRTAMHLQSL